LKAVLKARNGAASLGRAVGGGFEKREECYE